MFGRFFFLLFFSYPLFSNIVMLDNFEEAKKQAAFYEKPIALLFMGSEWCAPCRNLQQQVLSNPQFAKSAKDFFIFCKVEIGQGNDKTKTLKNEQLISEYFVESFPTIVILDSKGKCIYKESGNKGYQPYEYGEHLKKKYLEKTQVIVKSKRDRPFEALAVVR